MWSKCQQNHQPAHPCRIFTNENSFTFTTMLCCNTSTYCIKLSKLLAASPETRFSSHFACLVVYCRNSWGPTMCLAIGNSTNRYIRQAPLPCAMCWRRRGMGSQKERTLYLLLWRLPLKIVRPRPHVNALLAKVPFSSTLNQICAEKHDVWSIWTFGWGAFDEAPRSWFPTEKQRSGPGRQNGLFSHWQCSNYNA